MNNIKDAITNSRHFNVAIIGCGSIHTLHADAIAGNPDTTLSAVVDIIANKAEASSKKYNCRCFTDYDEVLKDDSVDAVHICTPHFLHAEMALSALEYGKHVLLEKPMAITVEDAEKLIKKSKSTRSQLGICFQNRYNPSSIKIKEFLASGKGGKILGARAFVTWYRDQEYYTGSSWRGTWTQEGGGVLINQSIHTLDLLQWFIGDIHKIKGSVDTRLLKGVIEVEDTAEAAITFQNGVTALFYATNCYCMNSPVIIEIATENAVLRLEESLVIKYRSGETESYPEIDNFSGEKAYWGNSHKTLINDFYSKLQAGNKFPVNGSEGLKALKMLQAIYKSHNTGKYVEF